MFVDFRSNALAHEADSLIGAPPFGEGLQQWLKESPVFHMDRVTTPLMVVAAGRTGILGMWEPYAALRYMHKPVELIILNSDEHVLTNPAERMASQGGTLDWFRFWLQGYEDRDPSKAEQYDRWRKLRSLRDSQVRVREPRSR
jgi:dipeptidyl aminopeptidase/acylaminoacyl peptidase